MMTYRRPAGNDRRAVRLHSRISPTAISHDIVGSTDDEDDMPSRRGLPVLALVLVTTPAGAVSDHLQCYKIEDPLAKATYVADVDGLRPDTGCMIKVPGKLLCVAADKTNVTPAPPGSAPAAPAVGSSATRPSVEEAPSYPRSRSRISSGRESSDRSRRSFCARP
jgi:hypothetical protein